MNLPGVLKASAVPTPLFLLTKICFELDKNVF
jgi:hypothetical protein